MAITTSGFVTSVASKLVTSVTTISSEFMPTVTSIRMSVSTMRAVSITATMFRIVAISTSKTLLFSFITGAALFFGWFDIGGFFLSMIVLSTARIETRNIRHVWRIIGAI